MSVNKVILIGNLGKDPEVKTLDNGSKVASFTLATSDNYVNKTTGEKVDQTDWHNVEAWGNVAGIIEKYLNKGSQVYIEGKLKVSTYEKDGETKYRTFIRLDTLKMLGSKGSGTQGGQPEDGGDLPF